MGGVASKGVLVVMVMVVAVAAVPMVTVVCAERSMTIGVEFATHRQHVGVTR